MALESIGGKGNITYTDVSKQPTSREMRPTASTTVPTKDAAEKAAPVSTEPAKFKEPEKSENGEHAARKMKNAIDQVNKKMKPSKTKCEFSYHEETQRVSIKVIDEETDEVIREIPPEETLEMLTKMWELAGLLVDERR